MVNTNYSTASTLSALYNSNATSMAQSLSRLASGKRVASASDDFEGYLKANTMQSQVAAYTTLKENMQDAKSACDYAKSVGDTVVADLSEMASIAAQNDASSNTTDQASYATQYLAVATRLANTIATANYNGKQMYTTGQIANTQINAENTAAVIDCTTTNSASGAGAGVATLTAGSTAALKLQMTAASTFTAQVGSFSTQLGQAMSLADVAVTSKQAAISAITDIDEVKEMSNLTNLQVRNQAAVSMMSQANLSQQSLAKLFA